jgi:chromosome segregation and condensation protein ScpB
LEGAPSASDCGGTNDIIKLQSFKLLTSHPAQKGRPTTFEMTMNFKQDIAQPIRV